MKLSRFVCTLAVLAIFVTGRPAFSSTTLYADRTTFESLLISPTTIDFNDQVVAPNTFTSYGPGHSVTLSGVTFTAQPNANLYAVSPSFDLGYDLGDGVVLSWQQASALNVLTIDLPAGTVALGFDFGREFGIPFDFSIQLSNGDNFTLPSAAGASFAGFIADSPFAQLTISASNVGIPMLDRVTFASNAVPEPASIVMTACGLGLIGLARLRRKSVVNS